jgi:hypothetical protein
VAAPSLIPCKPSDRVKTNRRDATALARLLRVGELTAVWVPDPVHEAMRNLIRSQTAAVETVRVHKQQVSACLLRHGWIFPQTKTWGARYRRWLQQQYFEHPADQIVLQEYVEAVRIAEERLIRIAIAEFLPGWSLAPIVAATPSAAALSAIFRCGPAGMRCRGEDVEAQVCEVVPFDRLREDGGAFPQPSSRSACRAVQACVTRVTDARSLSPMYCVVGLSGNDATGGDCRRR